MLKIKRKPYSAEELMWLSLRNNQLDGYKFRRQHPLLKYVADFTVTIKISHRNRWRIPSNCRAAEIR
jgi:very-short-patch-repair endonuclease